jgi:hypothetical protein
MLAAREGEEREQGGLNWGCLRGSVSHFVRLSHTTSTSFFWFGPGVLRPSVT